MENLRFKSNMTALLVALFIVIQGCGGSGKSDNSKVSNAKNSDDPSVVQYKIGGKTVGLIGSGLVLENNGGNDLSVGKNGIFTFSTALTDGESCDVKIASQPTNPKQFCEVVNGNQTVDGQNISNIEVRCETGFTETFDNAINANYWNSTAQYTREVADGALEYMLTNTSGSATNVMPFTDTSTGSVAADASIESVDEGMGKYMIWLQESGYHTTTDGEADGKRTGDVNAAIILSGDVPPFDVYYNIYRCLDDACSSDSDIEILGSDLLGTVALNEVARLKIDFGTISENKFSLQLNDGPIATFDPEEAGMPVNGIPRVPYKDLGVKSVMNQDLPIHMTAKFDNVDVNGQLYDDFNDSLYPDVSKWKRTYGKIAVENGQLLMETRKEYSGVPLMDNNFHSTDLYTNFNLIPNEKTVETDISMDPNSYITDTGGSQNTVEGFAVVVADFTPPGNAVNDRTDSVRIYTGLKEGASGVTAVVGITGCADAACQTTYLNETLEFTTHVDKGEAHRFKIECSDTNIINVQLDGAETIQFDCSTIENFSTFLFDNIKLSVLSKGTDVPGEEAFVSAYFDNVVVGTPE